MEAGIAVEVAYALPQHQELVRLGLPEGATVRDAILASGLLARYPDIDLDGRNKLGIFARLVSLDTVLRDHDRVEICRPLIADPKVVRRQRADEGRALKKGGGKAGPA